LKVAKRGKPTFGLGVTQSERRRKKGTGKRFADPRKGQYMCIYVVRKQVTLSQIQKSEIGCDRRVKVRA
jgi:hypothetical protein